MRFDETRKGWGDVGGLHGGARRRGTTRFRPSTWSCCPRLHGSKKKLRDKILAMTRVPSTFDHGGRLQCLYHVSRRAGRRRRVDGVASTRRRGARASRRSHSARWPPTPTHTQATARRSTRCARALAMGQYGHNNQPKPSCSGCWGCSAIGATRTSLNPEVIDRAYGVDFYAGDEDNGEMGAWFVLAALGLFSVSPASPDFDHALGRALFEKVSLHVPGRPVLGDFGCSSR